jgi:hypothetical protein
LAGAVISFLKVPKPTPNIGIITARYLILKPPKPNRNRLISSKNPTLKRPKPTHDMTAKPPQPSPNKSVTFRHQIPRLSEQSRDAAYVGANLSFDLPQPAKRECHASQKRK